MISAILIIIVILSIIVVINNISINTDMQEENNIEEVNNGNQSKYSKEQIISLLTSEKDENGMIGIIAFAELRLRNELNSLDESTAYLFRYDYKVINDDTINFYIVVPEPLSENKVYGGKNYYVWLYQASYTITEDTLKYFTKFDNGENINDIKVSELFRINTETKYGVANYVPSNTLSSYISQAMYKAQSILNYNPTKTEVSDTKTTENNDSSSNDNSNIDIDSNNKTNILENKQTISSQSKSITMPNLIDLTLAEAEDKLNELGIPFIVEKTNSLSSDNVYYQSISAGTNKTVDEFGTITIKSFQKVTALVRVTVKNSDDSKKYELVGKSIKVVLNGQANEDNYFNGESVSRVFSNITTPNITIQVYIENELIKSQDFNIEELVQTSEYYTDVTINI